jgi:hypothetical protein
MSTLPPPWDAVELAASKYGLNMQVRDRGGMFEVLFDRSPDFGDWSIAPTRVAFGRDPKIVAQRALEALRNMGPKLQKRLDQEMPEPPDSLTLAGGVASDGTVTTLRVERDGTVRLSHEDQEEIIRRIGDVFEARLRAALDPFIGPERAFTVGPSDLDHHLRPG